MNTRSIVLSLAIVAFAGSVTQAGNDFPPPWAGTGIQGGETHWRWDFFQGTNPYAPTSGSGFGTTQPTMNGGSWLPTAPGTTGPANGVICINPGEFLFIEVPNYPQINDFKYIWIQFHYYGGAEPVTSVAGPAGTPGSPYGPTVTPSPGPGGGLIGAQGWQFPFNPDFEFVRIFNPGNQPVYLEWLTIDTICAPTPGAGALLATAGLVAARRRRR